MNCRISPGTTLFDKAKNNNNILSLCLIFNMRPLDIYSGSSQGNVSKMKKDSISTLRFNLYYVV